MAGSVTATTSTVWELVDYDTNSETSQNASGTLEYKKHNILVRLRRHNTVTGFTSSVNDTQTLVDFTNGGVITLYTGVGDTYVCTSDRMRPDPEHADMWAQIQTWEYFTDWDTVPDPWIN